MNLNQQLINKLIHHYVGMERLKAGAIRRFVPILRTIDHVLLGMFAQSFGGTKKQRDEFLDEVRRLKTKVYTKFEQELLKELEQLARKETQFLEAALLSLLASGLVNKPQSKKVKRIMRTEVLGYSMPDFIRDLRDRDIKTYIANAKVAVANGYTLKKARDSIEALHVRRKNKSQALIRTLMAHVVSQADRVTIQANEHLIKGVKIVVTLDNRTTPICIQHSIEDKLYPIDNYPMAPFHYNCRSRNVPIVKSFKDLGMADKKRTPLKLRASMDGGAPENITFAQWLRGQGREIQNDVLGVEKAGLFRSGKLELKKFIDPTGQFYTLDELYSKYDLRG